MQQKQKQKSKDLKSLPYNQVTKGEYQLHILIESTSALSLNNDGSINAKIAISAFGKTQYTNVKTNIGVEETYWGEHFYFTKVFQNSAQAENQRLLISVYDYNKIMANSLVGSYEIDIQRIYSEKEHTMKHIWLALSNIERKFSQIAGYVKISASFLGQTDQNVELQVQPISSITKEKKVLVPPQIQRKSYQIIVDALQGKNIKPADGTTVDSYLGVQFGQIYQVSQTIPKNCNPAYSTRIYLPLSLPAVVENIAFRLNDFNFIQKVQVLGSYYLNINELIKRYENMNTYKQVENRSILYESTIPYNEFQWVNFYGPQTSTNREQQKNIQQFFPQLAPYYVGSVLMKVQIKQMMQPERKKQLISQQQIKLFKIDKIPPIFYKVTALITAAINIFQKNKRYRVSVKVGADQMQSQMVQAKNGFCFWNVQNSLTITVSPIQTIPDIFVYLVDQKNQKICFARYKPKQKIVQEDAWVKLQPDLAVVNLQNQQAGYLKIGIQMTPITRKENPVTRKMNSPLFGAYNANRRSGRLVIDLYCAQNLIPLDDDGGIDAFFSFNFLQSEVVTPVKSGTLNPVYYQRYIIESDILDQEGCPPIIVNAWDKDNVSKDFLGSVYIDVGDAIKNKSLVYGARDIPEPYWYTLTQNGTNAGKFLATFRMLPNYTQPIPRDIVMPKKQYQVLLVIMGLRGLKNSSVISVKQPFIQFDFAGLDVFNTLISQQVRNSKMIKTQPKQKGRSININTVVPAKVVLPQNYKYWPSLSCKVRDNILGSFYQPILGYFSINLQNSFLKSQQIKQQFKKQRAVLTQNKNKIIQKPAKLANINENLLMSMRNFVMKALNYNWKVLEPGIEDQLNSIRKNPNKKLDESSIVIFPNYQKQVIDKKNANPGKQQKIKYIQKYKEIIKRNQQYMQVGFDDVKTRGSGTSKRNKHYRYVLLEPYQKYYERVNGRKLGFMDQIPIKVGRVFQGNDMLTSLVRKFSQQDSVAGYYKGHLLINQYKQNRLNQQEDDFKVQAQHLLNLMLRKQKIHMYLYVIEAANLPPKDTFSNSDPYLKVKAGKQQVSFQKQYFSDQPNPQFFKKIHLVLQFPEDASIDIQIWDYDPVTADQLIGSTTINIEDRLQGKTSDLRFNNPIQTHNLVHKSSKRSQGLVRFWLDLVPLDSISLYRQFQISNMASSNYQVRVIVWNCEGMPNNDIQDMSDLYVQCNFNGMTQSTDVHYRSSSGDGSFNWRMIFPLKMPIKNPFLSFKVYDKDIITSNDYLASTSFSIQNYLQEAYETNSSITLYLGTQDLAKYSQVKGGKSHHINGQQMYDRFQLETMNSQRGDPNLLRKQGKIQISIQILTQQDAKKYPAGKGRQNPNQNPFLPQPKDRFQFSLNPLKMISQICGPKFRGKILVALCLVICLFFIIYFGVTFGGSVVGSLVAIAAKA